MKKFFSLLMLLVALCAFPVAISGCSGGGGGGDSAEFETPSDEPDEGEPETDE